MERMWFLVISLSYVVQVVQVFCICASVLYLCKCSVFVQMFSISASVFYLCECFVICTSVL